MTNRIDNAKARIEQWPVGHFFVPEKSCGEDLDYRALFREADVYREQLEPLLGYPLSSITKLFYKPAPHEKAAGRFVSELSPDAVGAEAVMLAFDTRYRAEGWYKWHVACGYGTQQLTLAVGEHGRGYGVAYTRSVQNQLLVREPWDGERAMALYELVCLLRDHPLTQDHLKRAGSAAAVFKEAYTKMAATIAPDAKTSEWVGLGEMRRQGYLAHANWASSFDE